MTVVRGLAAASGAAAVAAAKVLVAVAESDAASTRAEGAHLVRVVDVSVTCVLFGVGQTVDSSLGLLHSGVFMFDQSLLYLDRLTIVSDFLEGSSVLA